LLTVISSGVSSARALATPIAAITRATPNREGPDGISIKTTEATGGFNYPNLPLRAFRFVKDACSRDERATRGCLGNLPLLSRAARGQLLNRRQLHLRRMSVLRSHLLDQKPLRIKPQLD